MSYTNEAVAPIRKWKRGELNQESGYKFWQYCKQLKSGEIWLTPETFEKYQTKARENRKSFYSKNPNSLSKSRKKWRLNNKEAVAINAREYYAQNKTKILDRSKAYSSKWRIENADKRRDYWRKYQNNKTKSDPLFSLKRRLRRRVAFAMSKNGYSKKSKTQEIIGCDWSHLMTHIESKFVDGMNWDNRNLWHVDHIIPISSAKSEEDMIKLNHFTNLQPLWASDNIRKGNKTNQTEQ
jgi:hypothetical protein